MDGHACGKARSELFPGFPGRIDEDFQRFCACPCKMIRAGSCIQNNIDNGTKIYYPMKTGVVIDGDGWLFGMYNLSRNFQKERRYCYGRIQTKGEKISTCTVGASMMLQPTP